MRYLERAQYRRRNDSTSGVGWGSVRGMADGHFDRWFGRAANAYAFSALIPSSLVAIVSAYLSTGVHWISQFGAWGWFTSGLSAFVLSSAAFALNARTRLWRIEAKSRERMVGDSSLFDPMARVYENKRLYLRDLAPLGRKKVIGKKFVNCEIIGPGTAVLGLRSGDQLPFPQMKNCATFDVDCIEIDRDVISQLAVAFVDCDFDECHFYSLTLLFLSRENESLHWITPKAAILTLEDKTVGEP